MKKDRLKIKSVERLSRPRWKWSPLAAFALAVGLAVGSCGQIKYVPVETNTEVNVKDSLVINIKDSVRITERSVYKDYAGLLDTLRIKKNGVASMTAWADTTHNLINGTLETEPQEEKTKIIYKDRWKVRDSLVFKEVPVPVEVTKEVPYLPKFWRVTGVFGIVCLVLLLAVIGWKVYGFFKGKDILKILKKSV